MKPLSIADYLDRLGSAAGEIGIRELLFGDRDLVGRHVEGLRETSPLLADVDRAGEVERHLDELEAADKLEAAIARS